MQAYRTQHWMKALIKIIARNAYSYCRARKFQHAATQSYLRIARVYLHVYIGMTRDACVRRMISIILICSIRCMLEWKAIRVKPFVLAAFTEDERLFKIHSCKKFSLRSLIFNSLTLSKGINPGNGWNSNIELELSCYTFSPINYRTNAWQLLPRLLRQLCAPFTKYIITTSEHAKVALT